MKNSIAFSHRYLNTLSPNSPHGHDDEAAAEKLSKVDEVIVRDSWNKFLPFDGMLIEMFLEKLLLEDPGLADQFGPALNHAATEFLALLDLAVRELDPSTGVTLREAYRSAPAAAAARCRTLPEFGAFFATYGMTAEQWRLAGRAFVWVCGKIPYIEDFERENLQRGDDSALARFFAQRVAGPMVAHAEAEELALAPTSSPRCRRARTEMLAQAQDAGIFFYQTFSAATRRCCAISAPGHGHAVAPPDRDVVFLIRATTRPAACAPSCAILRRSTSRPDRDGRLPQARRPLSRPSAPSASRSTSACAAAGRRSSAASSASCPSPWPSRSGCAEAAREFLDQIAGELDWSQTRIDKRWSEITHEIRATGTYTQTFEELEFGAKVAWRNAPKCIGRLSWKNLIVRDRRHVTDPDEMFAECVEHLRAATNGGNVEIVLTLFRPTGPQERWGPRIWNSQLIRYASYRLDDGSVGATAPTSS
jgi:hypothetical protein